MVRSRHVVEDRITLFVRPFGAYHVYGTFAGGSHRAYVTFKEFSINTGSNSSHHHLLLTMDMNTRNQELLLQFVVLQGQEALLDAQAALVLLRRRRRRNRRQLRSCWVRPWLSAQ